MTAGAIVVIVGAGGNIGSHLVPHLGRMAGVASVVLVDRDVYDETNLTSQDIVLRDVGEAKVAVQERRLRRIAPALDVCAVEDALENVPLGLLRGDVILGCLDSRAARRALNLVAWRLGVPWIDAGVHGQELLVRVNAYRPGPGQPCLECAWDDRDYQTSEQEYPCAVEAGAPPATGAPSSLGALAAALQALECQKLLSGDDERLAIGQQVTLSALAHRHFVTRFSANPACRFDHETWRIDTLTKGPEEIALARAFALGRTRDDRGPLRLAVPHQAFATALSCPACRERHPVPLHLFERLSPGRRTCATCGRRLRAAGSDLVEWLAEADVPPALRDAPLAALGFRRGDVVTVAGDTQAAHLQIGDVTT
jgi:molybdopterin/thiamine biosynthesis adenylyltransferase